MKRRGSLRFSGRTPTALGSGGEDIAPRSHTNLVRIWAWRIATLLLVLCAANAFRRESLGNTVPWPAARPLRIFDSSLAAGAANTAASTWARAKLVGDGRSWGETFCALPTFAGEWAHRLAAPEVGFRGAFWAIGALWIPILIWWLAALALDLRRPSRGLALLILAQAFGVSYWLGSMRAPIRRIETASTCRAFDFGARTVSSGGMLTSAQSAEWHRARGFAGWAIDAQSRYWRSDDPTWLPNVLLLAHDGTQRRLLLPDTPVLLSLYSNERTIWQQARGQGALAILPAPWSAPGPPTGRELLTVKNIPSQVIEAWSGSVGDENLARQSRTRGLPVVGSASSGAGSDCFVWTLLPSDARTPSQIISALKNRRVAVAHALLKSETPANLLVQRQESQRPSIVAKSWLQAMSKLSRAERLNVWLQVLVLILALTGWGARAAGISEAPSGPRTVRKFLQRKRLLRRANGLAAMALAFAGSAWAVSLLQSRGGALFVLLAWLALDALYLYGRSAWKRVH